VNLTATKEINAALKTPGLIAVALKAGAEDALGGTEQ
jgi:hypothetical protein